MSAKAKEEQGIQQMVAECFNNWRVMGAHLTALTTKSEAVASAESKLLKENAALRQQLNDAQTHIFALQPFHEDLTPEDINDAFKKVVDGVQAWAQDTCQKLPTTAEQCSNHVRRMARADPRGVHKFQGLVRAELDISVAMTLSETDEDILVAMMMRALHSHVFGHPRGKLFGCMPSETAMCHRIAEALATTVTKKRDAVAISNWNAGALTALVSTQCFEWEQKKQLMETAAIISQLFGIFCPEDRFGEFHRDILESSRAVPTKSSSTFTNIARELDKTRRISTSPEFFANVNKMRCEDVLNNRKRFDLAKVSSGSKHGYVEEHLEPICLLSPGITMVHVSRMSESNKNPHVKTVRPPRMLVAWGGQAAMETFCTGKPPTLTHQFCLVKLH
ncbi:uncharacterized protein F5Z01DRAFT_747772 [Emericellopsis atlantica]|uniref:Uncharacterized protein n=1 Tax=Emericellopsis atlantica TaxID=2614577 RepID=A0A9P7ZUA3_9HYPO|nr:uncharacterized protein F5Z01DRAFT_747772 [Emericellopsis atlantica]KAG9257748.1 hypothetical protein F5Z01DRAFT_747772 [Emericellopsis atlantica]